MRWGLLSLVGVVALSLPAANAETRLTGRVVDENNIGLAGVHISLEPVNKSTAQTTESRTVSGPSGAFVFSLQDGREYLVSAEREGFFRLQNQHIELQEGINEITLILNHQSEVFESVDVAYSPPEIDFDRTSSQETLTGTEILDIPYPSTYTLRNAVRLLPGSVQDSRGGIHLNGGTEEQALYTLDGFNIGDPLTGRFESRLSVDAVRSLETSTGNLPAEYGKGSAGALALKTDAGDDKLRYSATNFLPTVENQKGWIIGGWTPRFNLSGPLRKGRAWFSENLDTQYDQQVVKELPAGQDRTSSWRVNNLLRNQVNLTPANILSTGFLINEWNAPHTGLTFLDPLETTVDRRSRQWSFYFKDQIYFKQGALAEIGYAASRTFGREIPQGQGLYLLTPSGKRGYFFSNAVRKAGRDQWLANLYLPSLNWAGSHQIKLGIDLDRLNYSQEVERTGYEYYRLDGTRLSRVVFGGSGSLSRSSFEASSYVQDAWRLKPNWLLEVGLRQDWDEILRNVNISLRLGFSWAPFGLERTKVSGGYAINYDTPNMRLFTRPLDQYSLTTYYLRDGSVGRGPALTIYTIDDRRLRSPRYQNWTLSWEQRLPGNLYARINYLRKRGRDGFTYSNILKPGVPYPLETAGALGIPLVDAVFRLENFRRDVYDSVESILKKTFWNRYEWMASYVHSRALSNAVVDINIDDPFFISNNVGPMPWDSPNRFLSWGYFPLGWKNWAVAYLLEWRTGFPFSIQDEEGRVIGQINSFRFPASFELNLHFERRFVFRGNRWAFRVGSNNLTNHDNPNLVNNNISSPQFMSFYGGQGRTLLFRIRWLGKK